MALVAQVRLMRDEFLKHRCLGQECHRLLEAAEKTVSHSFLCLGFRREPVSHASRTVVFRRAECVVVGEDVWLCMCGCVYVVFDNNNNNMPALLAFL